MNLSDKASNCTIVVLTLLIALLAGSLFFVDEVRSITNRTIVIEESSQKAALPFVPSPLVFEEVVEQSTPTKPKSEPVDPEAIMFEYIEVVDGCGPHFEGECLRVRSGPGLDYPVVSRLRNGVVLKAEGKIEVDGEFWYKVVFDEWLRYPNRVKGDWYVAADYVVALFDEGQKTTWDNTYATSTTKSITVDRGEQMLYAFEGSELFMEISISTGLDITPTPRGTFSIFKKTPSRYMQGPLPNLSVQKVYDLPGVPWSLYFTEGGAVIHGAYWHDSFGTEYSNGCVNMPLDVARQLYDWAELGTTVIVKD